MKKWVFLFLMSILLAVSGCINENYDGIEEISTEEMQTLLEMDDVQLLDVRTPEEFDEGFIAGAQNIDFESETFNEDIQKLDKTKPVILYCRTGGRSARCAKKMIEAGFVKVYDLDGGISAWEHEGLKVILPE
ncbi:rhodanese-like domain-containing protein [Mangrovimonas sp. AS39]|uniref:rhodanese-like domain-containing protein n=1 Tax=Mangrovimonas futianensis TaxID=2895523 RepID=UPI001E45DCA2|nr:rhodanese-like domain-containing protein [Mangrovimonas futianensis]MCF1191444.1 rhodanese-like domain-containing protein [Mangrovimonas futianensis]MCF1195139.1 rhodanese-like domain-containing protein [Mangrovimonas futianensis]MCF1421184.1 rhodanese-like domain-containing protein [Mangrovimonas futianensis]